ncbi:DUF429 domain-containing protein [Clostridium beijerinckii]|uniref:DUF429 domain-containing protein n=1 Tax=Clostridium beijerinckii TaxID=1520 RepID=UPI00117D7275|nr:DUF429 domain-containing protein [Clostridium beijerinckii]
MSKGSASSIFNVPCRQVVYMLNYEISNEKNKETLGKGISRQSFGIFNRIKEMNEFLNKLQIRKIINTKEYRKI